MREFCAGEDIGEPASSQWRKKLGWKAWERREKSVDCPIKSLQLALFLPLEIARATAVNAASPIEIGNLPDDVGVLKIYVQQLWSELANERAELQAFREHLDAFPKRHDGPKGEKLNPALAQLLNLPTPEQPASDGNHSAETASIELPDDDDDDEPKRKKGAHGRRRLALFVNS